MKTIIIGGGIGGLCTALALQHHGIEAVVYERTAAPADVGAGITLWPNAMKVLYALGVGASVTAAGARLTRSRICTASGAPLYETNLNELEERCGAPVVAIHRAALHGILANALEPGVLRFAMPCEGFTQDAHTVMARFKNGATVAADLLIGADGISSVIRRQMFPAIQLRYSGYTAWRGVIETADESALGLTSETWGRGARFGIVRIGQKRIYWFATHNQAPGDTPAPEAQKAQLLDIFGTWHDPIRQVLEATPATAILHNDVYDIPPFTPWTQDRVTLLGDAAHPTTPNLGQGACMAIESAFVLARSLKTEGDHRHALHRYETERQPRTAWVTHTSWRIGAVAQVAHPAASKLRNMLVRALPQGVMRSQMDRVAGFDVTNRKIVDGQ
ncbi:FAD-dependent monooxygenase [Roseiflexus sp.]|uniref:FAD-dependent monooxygenase n=1 Tax=Roseiflexus sp. TaxID=2562120 RepID=UPI00398A8739